MKLNHFKGFSLIELIVAISISIIVIGSIFTIFSNINLLEKITTKKSHEAIKIAYAYNLLKNDLSNSIPGIINDELSITLNKQNELILHRVSLEKNSQVNFKIMRIERIMYLYTFKYREKVYLQNERKRYTLDC